MIFLCGTDDILDFDDGGALWLLGLLVTECNLQDKYKYYLRVILLQLEFLGFDLELNNFIVCLPTSVCQPWFQIDL